MLDDAGKLAPLALASPPADGVLININVQAGQQVPAGSILFEVANLDPVYIKVPVFVGEEETIDPRPGRRRSAAWPARRGDRPSRASRCGPPPPRPTP